MRSTHFSFAILLVSLSASAHAEGGCPPGQMPYTGTPPEGSAASIASCGPIPNSAPTPVWANRWGAVADDGAGTFGMSDNERSKKKAERAAVTQCKDRNGGDCEVYMTYTNQCIAIAASEVKSNTARAPDEESAKQDSMAGCMKGNNGKGCRIYYSACSLPARIR